MKPLILLALLLVTAAHINAQPSNAIVKQYDRFENRTRYFTPPISVKLHLDLTVSFSFCGEGEGHPIEGFWLTFVSESSDWKYLKNSRLYLRVDEESIDLGKARARDNDVDAGHGIVRVREYLVYPVKYQVLDKIAKAKDVEFRVGDTEFRLYSLDRQVIQQLLSKVKILK